MRAIVITQDAEQARKREARERFEAAAHAAALEADAAGAGPDARAIGIGYAAAKLHKTPAHAAALAR